MRYHYCPNCSSYNAYHGFCYVCATQDSPYYDQDLIRIDAALELGEILCPECKHVAIYMYSGQLSEVYTSIECAAHMENCTPAPYVYPQRGTLVQERSEEAVSVQEGPSPEEETPLDEWEVEFSSEDEDEWEDDWYDRAIGSEETIEDNFSDFDR